MVWVIAQRVKVNDCLPVSGEIALMQMLGQHLLLSVLGFQALSGLRSIASDRKICLQPLGLQPVVPNSCPFILLELL